MARILLCNPVFLSQLDAVEASSPYFPLGLLYLAAYVRERGHEVSLFDGTFHPGPDAFVDHPDLDRADLVGISALLPSRANALQIAEMAQATGKPVVIGGPDATQRPEVYLGHPAVDLVVHHEGEQTITDLLDMLDRGVLSLEAAVSMPGLAFRSHGALNINPPREPIADLDSLPLPARDLVDMQRYLDYWKDKNGYASMTISTARGCPYGCDWCQDAVHGAEFRQRSPESVAAEVEHLSQNYDIDRLRVVEDIDGIDRSWIESWADQADRLGAVIPFEGLNELQRQDLPMLDIRDSL
jgi:radical SAM superfamily enzyme YgiQ (UPF0313 family)